MLALGTVTATRSPRSDERGQRGILTM